MAPKKTSKPADPVAEAPKPGQSDSELLRNNLMSIGDKLERIVAALNSIAARLSPQPTTAAPLPTLESITAPVEASKAAAVSVAPTSPTAAQAPAAPKPEPAKEKPAPKTKPAEVPTATLQEAQKAVLAHSAKNGSAKTAELLRSVGVERLSTIQGDDAAKAQKYAAVVAVLAG